MYYNVKYDITQKSKYNNVTKTPCRNKDLRPGGKTLLDPTVQLLYSQVSARRARDNSEASEASLQVRQPQDFS